jgi:hypothetical protein
MHPNDALNEGDAARFLGISPSFLSKRRCTGDGPLFVKYGKRVVYLRADLERWRDARRRASIQLTQRPPATAGENRETAASAPNLRAPPRARDATDNSRATARCVHGHPSIRGSRP